MFRIISISLFVFGIILNFITSKTPKLVEKFYSNGVNVYMIKCLSKISSILPFSLFEILIYILFIVFLILLSCLIYNVIKNPKKILYFFKDFILNIISIMGVIYFLFIILWGINYNRMDLQSSLIEDYNKKNNSTIKTV